MNRTNIWIVLLLVSVLLNGVLLGFGARTVFGPEERQAVSPTEVNPGFNMRAFLAALPEGYRNEARQRAQSERRALRQEIRDVGRARAQARAAMGADDFDPAVAAEALARVREAEAQIQARSEAIILDIVQDLTPDERREVLRQSMRAPRGRPAGRRGPIGNRPPPDSPSPERIPGEGPEQF